MSSVSSHSTAEVTRMNDDQVHAGPPQGNDALTVVDPSSASTMAERAFREAKPDLQHRRPSESFFESTSSEDEEPVTPVIGRASSVRISSPEIIQFSPRAKPRSAQLISLTSHNKKARSLSQVSEMSSEYSDQEVSPDRIKGRFEVGVTDTSTKSGSGKVKTTLPPETIVATVPEQLRNNQAVASHPNTVSKTQTGSRATFSISDENKNQGRRVTIRPSDLHIERANRNRQQRETVVTTPYPSGQAQRDFSNHWAVKPEIRTMKVVQDDVAHGTGSSPSHPGVDRFPSPTQYEILYLDIGLAGHPDLNTTLEIRIEDKGTYDDELLFEQIRSAYFNRLLGWSRFAFCFVRKIANIEVSAPLASLRSGFSVTDFMQHLSTPSIGHKRKQWVIWLRNHNRRPSTFASLQEEDLEQPMLTKRILRTRPAEKGRVRHSANILAPFDFGKFKSKLPRKFLFDHWDLNEKHDDESLEEGFGKVSASAVTFRSGSVSSEEGLIPSIMLEFHHTFNFWVLATISLLVMTLSISSTIVWVILGVPGTRPVSDPVNEATRDLSSAMLTGSWRESAMMRILTGLVLGIVVLLLGIVFEVSLVAGGWMLV